jgi:hypothetical protein
MYFAGLSTDIKLSVRCRGFTPFMPPADINIATKNSAQTANIEYLIILRSFTLTFLPFIATEYSLKAAIGHIHAHQARPKNIPKTNIKANKIRLPETIPFIAPSTDTYGEKKLRVTGKSKNDIKIIIFLIFCFIKAFSFVPYTQIITYVYKQLCLLSMR